MVPGKSYDSYYKVSSNSKNNTHAQGACSKLWSGSKGESPDPED